ncbi:protein rpi-1-like [Ixodes scapularis]|uniref:protein rpi-1-like n=1 Tax=Ixodes scapularis TaxID=6945 RepID=UPI001C3846D4|nr:protein rpi-1-like [Ixodes scapularis]
MKNQAFTALFVAALLPIANCAPSAKPEEEDRSCDKRDADAQKVAKPVITCNYFCFPYKNDDVYWVEKFYPDGTPCLFNFGPLESKCMNQDCHHPSSPIFNQTLNAPGAGNEEKKDEEEDADDGGEKKGENEEAGEAGEKEEEEKDGEAKEEGTNEAEGNDELEENNKEDQNNEQKEDTDENYKEEGED